MCDCRLFNSHRPTWLNLTMLSRIGRFELAMSDFLKHFHLWTIVGRRRRMAYCTLESAYTYQLMHWSGQVVKSEQGGRSPSFSVPLHPLSFSLPLSFPLFLPSLSFSPLLEVWVYTYRWIRRVWRDSVESRARIETVVVVHLSSLYNWQRSCRRSWHHPAAGRMSPSKARSRKTPRNTRCTHLQYRQPQKNLAQFFVRLNLIKCNRFSKLFHCQNQKKIAIILSKKIPPHFKCVATLPCEMSSVLKANWTQGDFCNNTLKKINKKQRV